MSKSISLDLLTVIEHECIDFIWNNKIKDFKCLDK